MTEQFEFKIVANLSRAGSTQEKIAAAIASGIRRVLDNADFITGQPQELISCEVVSIKEIEDGKDT